ncbi:MAG: ABC transporter permease [Patescibacteria group bacterium]
MVLTTSLQTAFKALLANKQRSLLTMLGVIIGIGSIVVIMSVGKGTESLVTSQISSIGSNLIVILPGAANDDGPPAGVFGIVTKTLKNDDIAAVEREIPAIVAASGYARGQATLQWQNQSYDATFSGVEHDYIEVEQADIAMGRFFTDDENRGTARVIILGSDVAADVFQGDDPIGERVRLGRENFTVIGVMEERGVAGFVNQDTQVFIPIETAQKIMLGINYVSLARLRVADGENLEAVAEQIRQILRDRHNITDPANDDFSVRNSAQALDLLSNLTGALSLFLAAIGSISLLVGGVGIMNIMLVSVNERIQEIGLRKSIGARRKDIEAQFLIEALIITIVGACIGIIGGALLSGAIALIVQSLDLNWVFAVPLSSIGIALGMAIVIGLVFGYYPARRAAKLDPIDALRYE